MSLLPHPSLPYVWQPAGCPDGVTANDDSQMTITTSDDALRRSKGLWMPFITRGVYLQGAHWSLAIKHANNLQTYCLPFCAPSRAEPQKHIFDLFTDKIICSNVLFIVLLDGKLPEVVLLMSQPNAQFLFFQRGYYGISPHPYNLFFS